MNCVQGNKTHGEGGVDCVHGNKTHGEGVVNCVQGSKTKGEGVMNCVYLQTCFYILFYTTFHLQQWLHNGLITFFNTATIFKNNICNHICKAPGKEG